MDNGTSNGMEAMECMEPASREWNGTSNGMHQQWKLMQSLKDSSKQRKFMDFTTRHYFVGDGDSSVYPTMLQEDPVYGRAIKN